MRILEVQTHQSQVAELAVVQRRFLGLSPHPEAIGGILRRRPRPWPWWNFQALMSHAEAEALMEFSVSELRHCPTKTELNRDERAQLEVTSHHPDDLLPCLSTVGTGVGANGFLCEDITAEEGLCLRIRTSYHWRRQPGLRRTRRTGGVVGGARAGRP